MANWTTFPPYNKLNSLIKNNYEVASQYYSLKEHQFEILLASNFNINKETFVKKLSSLAKSYYPNVTKQIYNILSGKEDTGQKEEKFTVSKQNILDALVNSEDNKKKNRVTFEAGLEFENFLSRNFKLSANQSNQLQSFILNNIGKLLNDSALTAGLKQTRTDLAFKTKGNVSDQIELTKLLDIQEIDISKQDYMTELFRKIRLQGINQNVLGFQVKTYSTLKDGRWMNSSVMMNTLNSIFDNKKTWSSEYAVLYPIYYLSRYIINILNPVNIGIIYGGGFIFSSELLSKYRFYMQVAYQDTKKIKKSTPQRGGGVEVKKPYIANDTILMYQLRKSSNNIFAQSSSKNMRNALYNGKQKILVAKLTDG